MRLLDDDKDDDAETVFRDMILLTLGALFVVAALMFPYLNPKAEARAATREGVEPPGNVMVEVRWPDELDTDVDLWVQAPGDVPVGYSNKGGAIFNLLRDDLGNRNDATRLNYEVAFARGVPEGEYTVNLHLYRNLAGKPVPVTVVTSVKAAPAEPARQQLARETTQVREGQEVTAYRFRLDEKGGLVPGSVTDLARNLRSGPKP